MCLCILSALLDESGHGSGGATGRLGGFGRARGQGDACRSMTSNRRLPSRWHYGVESQGKTPVKSFFQVASSRKARFRWDGGNCHACPRERRNGKTRGGDFVSHPSVDDTHDSTVRPWVSLRSPTCRNVEVISPDPI